LLPIDFYSLNAAYDRKLYSSPVEAPSHFSIPLSTPTATHTEPEIIAISPATSNDPQEAPTAESVHSLLAKELSVHSPSAEEFPSPDLNHLCSSPKEPSAHIHHMTTRSQTGHSKPKDFSNFKLYHSRHTTKHPWKVLLATSPPKPATFSKAISDPNWCVAMASEFATLMDNKTWPLCPRPLDRHVI
jgi:hypothetical protein